MCRRKAHLITDFFNSLEGVECTFCEGAMYSFPTIKCDAHPLSAAFHPSHPSISTSSRFILCLGRNLFEGHKPPKR
jgi:aspartate/methionine/tyrosine aminotransferase